MLWEDIERSVRSEEQRRLNPDTLVCPKCGSDFFTVEEYQRYRTDMRVGLGQRPNTHPTSPKFYFIKCICGEIIEPPIHANTSPIARIYEKFVETVKKVLSAETKE